MSDWFAEYGMFLAKALSLAIVVVLVIAIAARARGKNESARLRVEELNERYRSRQRRLRLAKMGKKQRKAALKAFKKEDKRKVEDGQQGTVWVIDFHGDLKASGTSRLSQEISAVLGVAETGDEVVVRLESPGGLVHAYGLAAAELDRLRDAGITTTICIDKVAASGGYLMACCGDKLRAAPFAVIGSIGVVAQLPNIHRLLKKHDIDVELLTAGRYKRTLTVLGENTDEGREKFMENLEDTHDLFKQYVGQRRPELDIEAVSTGEIWYGSEAVKNGLVDEVGTSESYLVQRMATSRVVSLALEKRQGITERLGKTVSVGIEHGIRRLYEVLEASHWQRR